MQVGVALDFDPCLGADAQSGMFAQMVPRDADLLPPAIGLARLADNCTPKVSDAAVESELMTLINQIETHAGRPVILKLSPPFRTVTTPRPRWRGTYGWRATGRGPTMQVVRGCYGAPTARW